MTVTRDITHVQCESGRDGPLDAEVPVLISGRPSGFCGVSVSDGAALRRGGGEARVECGVEERGLLVGGQSGIPIERGTDAAIETVECRSRDESEQPCAC